LRGRFCEAIELTELTIFLRIEIPNQDLQRAASHKEETALIEDESPPIRNARENLHTMDDPETPTPNAIGKRQKSAERRKRKDKKGKRRRTLSDVEAEEVDMRHPVPSRIEGYAVQELQDKMGNAESEEAAGKFTQTLMDREDPTPEAKAKTSKKRKRKEKRPVEVEVEHLLSEADDFLREQSEIAAQFQLEISQPKSSKKKTQVEEARDGASELEEARVTFTKKIKAMERQSEATKSMENTTTKAISKTQLGKFRDTRGSSLGSGSIVDQERAPERGTLTQQAEIALEPFSANLSFEEPVAEKANGKVERWRTSNTYDAPESENEGPSAQRRMPKQEQAPARLRKRKIAMSAEIVTNSSDEQDDGAQVSNEPKILEQKKSRKSTSGFLKPKKPLQVPKKAAALQNEDIEASEQDVYTASASHRAQIGSVKPPPQNKTVPLKGQLEGNITTGKVFTRIVPPLPGARTSDTQKNGNPAISSQPRESLATSTVVKPQETQSPKPSAKSLGKRPTRDEPPIDVRRKKVRATKDTGSRTIPEFFGSPSADDLDESNISGEYLSEFAQNLYEKDAQAESPNTSVSGRRLTTSKSTENAKDICEARGNQQKPTPPISTPTNGWTAVNSPPQPIVERSLDNASDNDNFDEETDPVIEGLLGQLPGVEASSSARRKRDVVSIEQDSDNGSVHSQVNEPEPILARNSSSRSELSGSSSVRHKSIVPAGVSRKANERNPKAPKPSLTPKPPKAETPKSESKPKNKPKQSRPSLLAMGRLTEEQTNEIRSALEQYRIDKEISEFRLNELVQKDAQKDGKELWKFVCEEVSDLPRRKVIEWSRRNFHNFEARGAWTEEQDEDLRREYELQPQKWKDIGQALNRFPEDCRDRWRNYLINGDNMKTDVWEREEELKLKKVVRKCLDKIRRMKQEEGESSDEANIEEGLDWNKVSELMNRTRSRLQCIRKWKIIKAREESDTEDAGGSQVVSHSWRGRDAAEKARKLKADEKLQLLYAIRDSEVGREAKIPWLRIKDEFFQGTAPMTLRLCYKNMKRNIEGSEDMKLREVVRILIAAFEECAPNEPEGFRNHFSSLASYTTPTRRRRSKGKKESKVTRPSPADDNGGEGLSMIRKKKSIRSRMKKQGESQESMDAQSEAGSDIGASFKSSMRPRSGSVHARTRQSTRGKFLSEEKVISEEDEDDDDDSDIETEEQGFEASHHSRESPELGDEETLMASRYHDREDLDQDPLPQRDSQQEREIRESSLPISLLAKLENADPDVDEVEDADIESGDDEGAFNGLSNEMEIDNDFDSEEGNSTPRRVAGANDEDKDEDEDRRMGKDTIFTYQEEVPEQDHETDSSFDDDVSSIAP